MSRLNPVLIAGPTAAGKSEVAILLAEKLGGEIIAVDSMQVYRGMDIGTAKPDASERARAPHHLIDVADVTEHFNAAQFVRLANAAWVEIQSRGRVPILCGGTGLYFKALFDGLGEAPPADAGLRSELEALPMTDLLLELAQRDPAAYERIDRQNPRRVIRAVEVMRLTGKPFSALRAHWHRGGAPDPAYRIIVLWRSADELYQRISARVDQMFQRGLVAETEALLHRGLAGNRTAAQALGYRQVMAYLRGELSLEDTIELVKVRTRQFAKRQMTWFKRQLQVTWIEARAGDDSSSIASKIERMRRDDEK